MNAQAILNPVTTPQTSLTGGATLDLRTVCPAYVAPADIRPRKQAGTTAQVTARRIKGGKWEGIFRDTDGSGVETANHPTETDAVKAVALYANRVA